MFFVYLAAGALAPLLITPGLLFHYDTAPKVIVIVIAAAWALLRFRELPAEVNAIWRRPTGRWLAIVAALQLIWFGIATATSSRPWFSLFGSNWRRFGLVEAAGLLVVGMAAAAGLSARPGGIRTLLRIVVGAGLVASLYGICQYFGIDPLQPVAAYQAHAGDSVIVRPPGTMGHADYFGWWLAIEFFCAIALAQNETLFWRRIATVTVCCTFTAVVLSGTRAALLSIIVGLVSMALMSTSGIRIRRRHVVVGALAVALFATFVFSNAGALLRARAVWSGDEPAGGARPLLWRDSLRMAAARPVFGAGPDTFLTAFAKFQSEDLSRLFPDFHHESPHNLLLDALTSTGAPGLLLVTCWAVLAGFAVVRARRGNSPFGIPLGAALIASATAAMFSAASIGPVMLSLLVIGILVALDDSVTPAGNPANIVVKWPARLPMIAFALCLAAFGTVLAVEDFRLQLFRTHPDETNYLSLLQVSLPGAGEDLYVSRVMQQECGKRVNFASYLACRQQAMRSAGRALGTSDDTANAWYSLSMMSAAQNEPVWTRKGLEQAELASPNWFKPHWSLARLLAGMGETGQAATEASRAAFLDANRDAEVVETAGQLTAQRH